MTNPTISRSSALLDPDPPVAIPEDLRQEHQRLAAGVVELAGLLYDKATEFGWALAKLDEASDHRDGQPRLRQLMQQTGLADAEAALDFVTAKLCDTLGGQPGSTMCWTEAQYNERYEHYDTVVGYPLI